MKSLSILVSLPALVAFVGALTINTPPTLVQCQPSQLQWSGGSAPYYVTILPGGQPSSAPLKSFPEENGTSLTWQKVDIASGTSVTISCRDGTGDLAYSSPITIQNSADSSCVDPTVTENASSASAGSSAGSSSSNTAPSAAPPHPSSVTRHPTSVQAATGTATASSNRFATSASAYLSATSTHSSSSGTLYQVSTLAASIASTLGFVFSLLF